MWNKATNTRKKLLPPFNLADYSYNQDKMCLYCYNTTDAQLQCYDFTLGKNTIKGPKIHPSMLIQNCIFDEHIKKTYIPTYLSQNKDVNIEYDY